jgi:hypothetical protein
MVPAFCRPERRVPRLHRPLRQRRRPAHVCLSSKTEGIRNPPFFATSRPRNPWRVSPAAEGIRNPPPSATAPTVFECQLVAGNGGHPCLSAAGDSFVARRARGCRRRRGPRPTLRPSRQPRQPLGARVSPTTEGRSAPTPPATATDTAGAQAVAGRGGLPAPSARGDREQPGAAPRCRQPRMASATLRPRRQPRPVHPPYASPLCMKPNAAPTMRVIGLCVRSARA